MSKNCWLMLLIVKVLNLYVNLQKCCHCYTAASSIFYCYSLFEFEVDSACYLFFLYAFSIKDVLDNAR